MSSTDVVSPLGEGEEGPGSEGDDDQVNMATFTGTPWKINMEHINHPFGKKNDLPNLYDYVPR